MKFRYARHTTDLAPIAQFYTEIIGLKILGGFEGHSDYDGVFLGLENLDWHLEITVSLDKPKSNFDEDDALVFYLSSMEELAQKRHFLQQKGIQLLTPKNPYWQQNGIMIQDPDGFNLIFSVRQ